MIKALLSGLGVGLIMPFICIGISEVFGISLSSLQWLWPSAVCVMAIASDLHNQNSVLAIGIAINMTIYAVIFLGLYSIVKIFRT
jgi:hypothetical protein